MLLPHRKHASCIKQCFTVFIKTTSPPYICINYYLIIHWKICTLHKTIKIYKSKQVATCATRPPTAFQTTRSLFNSITPLWFPQIRILNTIDNVQLTTPKAIYLTLPTNATSPRSSSRPRQTYRSAFSERLPLATKVFTS